MNIDFIHEKWAPDASGAWMHPKIFKPRSINDLARELIETYPTQISYTNVSEVVELLKDRANKLRLAGPAMTYTEILLKHLPLLPLKMYRTNKKDSQLMYYLVKNPGVNKELVHLPAPDDLLRAPKWLKREITSRPGVLSDVFDVWDKAVQGDLQSLEKVPKSNPWADTIELLSMRNRAADMYIDEIEPISYDADTYCLWYIDQSKIYHTATPAWDSVFSRINQESGSNLASELFCAKIWQVFVPGNRGREALWLHGFKGKDGKSTISEAIVDIIGQDSATSLDRGSYHSHFFFSHVHEKVFAVISDNRDPRIISSGKIHNLLGGDLVPVEYKGRQPFYARVAPKLMINSNCLPEISNVRHEKSRILYLRIAQPSQEILEQGDATFKDQLVAEAPGFLAKCRDAFPKYCPANADLVLPQCLKDLREQCVSEDSVRVDKFIEDTFEFVEGASVTSIEFLEVMSLFVKRTLKQDKLAPVKYLKQDARSKILQRCTKKEINGEIVFYGLGLKLSQPMSDLEAQKRGRGRPRSESEPEPNLEPSSQKRGRGRPRKESDSEGENVIKMDEEFYRKAAEFV